MIQYLEFLQQIKFTGSVKSDRTGTGTKSVFGRQMRFDLQKGFPLLTTKKVHLKSIIHELIWFLSGSTNVKYLRDNGVTIWDEWADENGELGPVYGAQWRAWSDTKVFNHDTQFAEIETATADGYQTLYVGPWPGYKNATVMHKKIDQIAVALDQIKNNPDSRRIIVNAWNPGDLQNQALPPCHCFFQFYVSDMTEYDRIGYLLRDKDLIKKLDGILGKDMTRESMIANLSNVGVPLKKLSCQLYQRSADAFLGVPFNIASYALLTHMFAQQAGMAVGDFIWTGGDCHLYSNHMDQANLQMTREPKALPRLVIKKKPETLFDYKFEDFEVVEYDPHPAIKADVAV